MKRKILSFLFAFTVCGFVLAQYWETHVAADPIVAEYYIAHFAQDTFAQNAVAAVYLNYRVFDSIFETLMLVVSVTAVINFSWRQNHE